MGRSGLKRCEPSTILSGIFRDIEDKSLSASREKILESAILSLQARAWDWPPISNISLIPIARLREFAVSGSDTERYFAIVILNTVAEPSLDLMSEALNYSDSNDFSFGSAWSTFGEKYAKAKGSPECGLPIDGLRRVSPKAIQSILDYYRQKSEPEVSSIRTRESALGLP